MAAAAGKENAAKTQKGSKGYPKGVIETGRDIIKYQARVSYKPDGGKTVQRSAGSFDTPEEAALQIATYEAKIAEGIDRRLGWSADSLSAQARPGVRSILVIPRVHMCANPHYAARKAAPGTIRIAESSFKLQAAVGAFRGVPQGRTAGA